MRFLVKAVIIIFITCCLHFDNSICFSQRLPLRVYSVKEGLPQSQVQTIIQDGKGYLWIGTADGIAQYDGKSFTTYTKKNGLVSNYIHTSFIDAHGDLWISHRTYGLSKLNIKTKKSCQMNQLSKTKHKTEKCKNFQKKSVFKHEFSNFTILVFIMPEFIKKRSY